MDTLPEEISARLKSIYIQSDLWTIEDKLEKTLVSVQLLLVAAGNLNVGATPDMDGEGKLVFPSRDHGV